MEILGGSATEATIAYGRKLGRSIRSSIEAFAGDLAGLSSAAREWQFMIFVADEIEIYARGKRGPERVAKLGTDLDEKSLEPLSRRLSSGSKANVSLRFSSGRAVRRLISLPASAGDVVPAIVRNKVESLAPWPLTEALWGYRVSDEPPQHGLINVEVGIVGKKQVQAVLSWLKRIGIGIAGFDIAGSVDGTDAIPIDFVRDNAVARVRKQLARIATWAATAAALLFAVGVYGAVSAMSELRGIDDRTAELTGALRNQAEMSGEGGKLAEARKLVERKRIEKPAVEMIEALTRLVPNDAWLDSLDYEDHQLTVVGRGASVPPIVEALERSGIFSNVNFASPTQHDAVAKIDTFSISASVQPRSISQ
jgi:general secretion pathway protein L